MNKQELKEAIGELDLVDTVFDVGGVSYIDTAVSVMQVYDLIEQLDEPEVLSQKWIINNQERKGVHFFVNVTKLQNLLVQKHEITEEQVMDWLDKNDFYDHITAETVLERAVDKGELSYYGTKYSVIETPIDEPEVLSQEWIEEHTYYEDEYDFYYADPDELQNLIVPKQELPVIPKFVADWVLRYRDKYDLYPALRILENNTFVWGTIYEWYRMNTHKFVNAYLTGEYEVEEEPKYYVDLDTAAYVAKWKDNDRVDIYTDGISGSDEFEFHLTEEEIKNYDERFWSFATPVEEGNDD